MKKWQVLSSGYLYKTPFGNLRTDRCLLPNGTLIEAYHVCEYSDWVNCVALTPQQEVILVRQYPHGAGAFYIEVPAGSPEKDESLESAVRRELMEETGYGASTNPILLSSLYPNPATSNNRIHTFLVRDVTVRGSLRPDDTEDIEVITLPLNKAEDMITSGEINQLFTVCAIRQAICYLNRMPK